MWEVNFDISSMKKEYFSILLRRNVDFLIIILLNIEPSDGAFHFFQNFKES